MTQTQVLAHGFGGLTDLPVPARDAFTAAAVALLVSFAVLAFAWRAPKFRGDESGIALPRWFSATVRSRITKAVVVTLGLAYAAWITFAAFFGQNLLVNPTFGTVYVVLWVGLVPAALLFGRVYRLCNPLRWVHRLLCLLVGWDPADGRVPYPDRLGLWPAAAGLFAFTWLELVNPDYSVDLNIVRTWFLVLAVLLLAGALVFGDVVFSRADPFEVYSALVARLSPWGRRTDGTLVIRYPLENLDGLAPPAGLTGVVAVLLGSTAFDAFHESIHWFRFSKHFGDHQVALDSVGLFVFCAVVFVSFSLAALLTGRLGEIPRRHLPRLLAHSLVPIVVGYIVAHYLSFFVSVSIGTLQQLGDPLSRGWTYTNFAAGIDKYAIYDHPTAIAVTKVVAVVTGHVLAVISAHDRTIKLLPRRRAVIGQLPMLVLMVAYTLTGLALLFSS